MTQYEKVETIGKSIAGIIPTKFQLGQVHKGIQNSAFLKCLVGHLLTAYSFYFAYLCHENLFFLKNESSTPIKASVFP